MPAYLVRSRSMHQIANSYARTEHDTLDIHFVRAFPSFFLAAQDGDALQSRFFLKPGLGP